MSLQGIQMLCSPGCVVIWRLVKVDAMEAESWVNGIPVGECVNFVDYHIKWRVAPTNTHIADGNNVGMCVQLWNFTLVVLSGGKRLATGAAVGIHDDKERNVWMRKYSIQTELLAIL
jgi:hypothetical protein